MKLEYDDKSIVVSKPKALVLGPNDGEKRIRRWGHPFTIKVDELNGGAKQFAVGSEQLEPGDIIHPHKHDDFEELLMISSGNGIVQLGDERFHVEQGSLVFIPPNTWHGLENKGSTKMDLMWVFPQLGMENYFRDTSVPAEEEPMPFPKDELNHIREQHSDKVQYQESELSHYEKL